MTVQPNPRALPEELRPGSKRRRVSEGTERLERTGGAAPTSADLAADTGLPETEVRSILRALIRDGEVEKLGGPPERYHWKAAPADRMPSPRKYPRRTLPVDTAA